MSHLKLLKDVNQTKKLDLVGFIKESYFKYGHSLSYCLKEGEEDKIFTILVVLFCVK